MNKRAKSGPNIKDVAEMAGVSIATVSRVLTQTGYIGSKTRGLVIDAARKLQYTPNITARQLRNGAARTVLVLVGTRRDPPFFTDVLAGIDKELSKIGYVSLSGKTDEIGNIDKRTFDIIFGGYICGAIVLATDNIQYYNGKQVVDSRVPIISVCAEIVGNSAPSVLVNDNEISRIQLRHLVGLGHKSIGYISGPQGNYNDTRRYSAFLEEAKILGLTENRLTRLEGAFDFASGIRAAEVFLRMERRPTAIASCSDEMAIAFMKTIRKAGLKIPKDVSIVGCDGIELADYVEPSLTTVRLPRYDMGVSAARTLLKCMSDGPESLSNLMFDGWLDVRDSTDYYRQ